MAKKTALGLELNVGLGNSVKNLKSLNFSFKALEKEVSRFSHLKDKAIEFTVANATLGALSTLGGLLKSASVDAYNYSRSMKDALADGKLDELLINKTKAFGDFMAVTARRAT